MTLVSSTPSPTLESRPKPKPNHAQAAQLRLLKTWSNSNHPQPTAPAHSPSPSHQHHYSSGSASTSSNSNAHTLINQASSHIMHIDKNPPRPPSPPPHHVLAPPPVSYLNPSATTPEQAVVGIPAALPPIGRLRRKRTPSHDGREHSCCGTVHHSAARARHDRDARAQLTQPWIVLKLMVFVTLALMGYAGYVYIGVFVLPMLRQSSSAIAEGVRRAVPVASRGTGIALLVPFVVLYVWMVWAYFKVVLTSPGYARDYVHQGPKPLFPPLPLPLGTTTLDVEGGKQVTVPVGTLGGRSYEDITRMMSAGTVVEAEAGVIAPQMNERSASTATMKSGVGHIRFDAGEMVNVSHGGGGVEAGESAASLSLKDILREGRARAASDSEGSVVQVQTEALEMGVVEEAREGSQVRGQLRHRRRHSAGCLLCFAACRADIDDDDDDDEGDENGNGNGEGQEGDSVQKPRRPVVVKKQKAPPRPRTYIARRPPMTPALDPAHRYCDKEGFVKPRRSHHCRNCGTCILKYDHHCPWIGQCVGARNHKFFLNFCQAAFFFTAYTFVTLLVFTIEGFKRAGVDVSPQQIVIIALSALFALFTSSLAISHVFMIMHGQTTVESMQIRSMKDRENDQLARAFRFWEIRAKNETLREWDREWGKLDTEGHVWWIGGKRREWEDVMGTNWLGWILPIGRSLNDGLDYPANPRFDPDGRWRKREEWPVELR